MRFWLGISGNSSEKLHCRNAVNMPYLAAVLWCRVVSSIVSITTSALHFIYSILQMFTFSLQLIRFSPILLNLFKRYDINDNSWSNPFTDIQGISTPLQKCVFWARISRNNCWARISRMTCWKSYMLLLTEYTYSCRNEAVWDTLEQVLF